uniref:CSON013813 protein n=1 Tax=Culicoides sonorensis TaxID=179676 RepID=A0A336KNJ9_CULSO
MTLYPAVFNLCTSYASSYVTPPIVKTITSCGGLLITQICDIKKILSSTLSHILEYSRHEESFSTTSFNLLKESSSTAIRMPFISQCIQQNKSQCIIVCAGTLDPRYRIVGRNFNANKILIIPSTDRLSADGIHCALHRIMADVFDLEDIHPLDESGQIQHHARSPGRMHPRHLAFQRNQLHHSNHLMHEPCSSSGLQHQLPPQFTNLHQQHQQQNQSNNHPQSHQLSSMQSLPPHLQQFAPRNSPQEEMMDVQHGLPIIVI